MELDTWESSLPIYNLNLSGTIMTKEPHKLLLKNSASYNN